MHYITRFFSFLDQGLAALFLLVTFLISFAFIFVTSTAQEIQGRIRNLNNGPSIDAAYTTGFVDEQGRELDRIRNRIASLTAYKYEQIACIDFARTGHSSSGTAAAAEPCGDAPFGGTDSMMAAAVSEARGHVIDTLNRIPGSVRIDYNNKDVPTLLRSGRSVFQQVQNEVQRLSLQRSKPESLITYLAQLNDALDKQLNNLNGRYVVETQHSSYIVSLQLAVESIEEDIKKEKAALSEAPFSDKNFVRLVEDLTAYREVFFGLPYSFVMLPSITLTLIMTLFMGLLGGAIALTREIVFDKAQHPLSNYIFRIGLSAAVALAVFFAAGAGALALAKPAGGTNNAAVELSPYLVSFVAIIAGYLSLRVTNWLREFGSKVFQVSQAEAESRERWGIDLASHAAAANISTTDLAAVTLLDPGELDCIFSNEKPASIDIQRLIAAALRMPMAQIFTDIAPRNARASSTSETQATTAS